MIKLDAEISREIANDVEKREKEKLNSLATYSNDAIYERPHKSNAVIGNFSDDVDKIINTKAYTRYMGKTQVFSMVQNDLITTRGLHVQLVSKIARNIGRALGFNEDLIEAISLGHDLGHTPFGHEGERALNNITKDFGYYFKHNAQSVRILRDLLDTNVSMQVLDGIACHNGESVRFSDDDKKNGNVYKPNMNKKAVDVIREYQECFKKPDADKKMVPMTYEGCIMRISDLISYVGRDFEDAIALGLLKRSDLPKDIKDVLGNENRQIVRSLTYDIINNSYGKDSINMSKECHEAFEKLFDFNYENIYLNPKAKPGADKRDNMFGIMYEKYLNDIKDGKESSIHNFINTNKKEYKEITRPEIMVVDYIAGMTDEYFKREYEDYVMPKEVGRRFY